MAAEKVLCITRLENVLQVLALNNLCNFEDHYGGVLVQLLLQVLL
jgi:hypothetical protein